MIPRINPRIPETLTEQKNSKLKKTKNAKSLEQVHRYNIRMLERDVLQGFQRWDITHLIDLLQNVVLANHGVLYNADWLNASEIRNTPEQQGVIALQSKEQEELINTKGLEIREMEEESLKKD